jgi:hypothetical protein
MHGYDTFWMADFMAKYGISGVMAVARPKAARSSGT